MRTGPKVNQEFGGIVRQLRGDLSYEQASIRCEGEPSGNAIRVLEQGKIGREHTVRAFAAGFADRICELHAEDVRQAFGTCDCDRAADWLARKAGFTQESAAVLPAPHDDPVTRRELLERMDRIEALLRERMTPEPKADSWSQWAHPQGEPGRHAFELALAVFEHPAQVDYDPDLAALDLVPLLNAGHLTREQQDALNHGVREFIQSWRAKVRADAELYGDPDPFGPTAAPTPPAGGSAE